MRYLGLDRGNKVSLMSEGQNEGVKVKLGLQAWTDKNGGLVGLEGQSEKLLGGLSFRPKGPRGSDEESLAG